MCWTTRICSSLHLVPIYLITHSSAEKIDIMFIFLVQNKGSTGLASFACPTADSSHKLHFHRLRFALSAPINKYFCAATEIISARFRQTSSPLTPAGRRRLSSSFLRSRRQPLLTSFRQLYVRFFRRCVFFSLVDPQRFSKGVERFFFQCSHLTPTRQTSRLRTNKL